MFLPIILCKTFNMLLLQACKILWAIYAQGSVAYGCYNNLCTWLAVIHIGEHDQNFLIFHQLWTNRDRYLSLANQVHEADVEEEYGTDIVGRLTWVSGCLVHDVRQPHLPWLFDSDLLQYKEIDTLQY